MDEDMAWAHFTADFDYQPTELNGRSTIAYKAGMRLSVRRECLNQAIAVSAAEEIPAVQATGAVANGAQSTVGG